MSLPWFPFHIKDFVANTLRLNTEATGAYLRLMLDYYQQEEGPPDDDEILASITGLPILTWKRHRKVLQPLFKVVDGHWCHDRIEEEIETGLARMAGAKDKAEKAAAARYGNKPKDAPSKPRASAKQISEHPHSTLTLTSTLSNERVVPAAPNDDARQAENGLEGFKKVPSPPSAPNPLGAPLPETWVPSSIDQDTAREYGMTPTDIEHEVLAFHAYNAQHGTFSHSWSATWRLWCIRWKEREAAKPKPAAARVDVNASASEPYVPKPAEWERALARWQSGDENGWPRALLGPEPGQPRCRVPRELFEQYNIDPATGRVSRAARKEPS